MPKLPYMVIAVVLLTSLAACGTGGPWTLSRSANGITLRWWSDEVADAQAAGTAAAYCIQMGRAVETIYIERDGSAAIGHYRCV